MNLTDNEEKRSDTKDYKLYGSSIYDVQIPGKHHGGRSQKNGCVGGRIRVKVGRT